MCLNSGVFIPWVVFTVPKVDPITNRAEGSQSQALWIPTLTVCRVGWGGGGGRSQLQGRGK